MTSVEAARAFIHGQRCRDGLWHEFHTLAGLSDEWVSGFIAHALAQSSAPNAVVPTVVRTLIGRQRWNGGWSFNPAVPTDCDSSAWVLMAFNAAALWRPSSTERAIRYIEEHYVSEVGGFSTYSATDGIDRFIGAADPGVVSGWTSAHPCVTGTVLQALLTHGVPPHSEMVRNAGAYLLRQQSASGIWRSYWWTGNAYCTYQSLRALCMARILDAPTRLAATSFLLSQQRDDGRWVSDSDEQSSVFETAFSVLSLLLVPTEETMPAAARGVAWLVGSQSADGSWASAPILRIPPPTMRHPEELTEWRIDAAGTGVVLADYGLTFTSAAVSWALSVYLSITQ